MAHPKAIISRPNPVTTHPLPADEETSIQVQLRKEYERAAGAVAHLTVIGGRPASRRVSIRTRRSTPEVTSSVAWVGRRPQTTIRVHCQAGAERAEPCKGRISLSLRRYIRSPLVGFPVPIYIGPIREFAIGFGRTRSLSVRLDHGVRKGEKRRMLRAYVWIESTETTRTDITLRSKVPRR